jgi:hypothetical protein
MKVSGGVDKALNRSNPYWQTWKPDQATIGFQFTTRIHEDFLHQPIPPSVGNT